MKNELVESIEKALNDEQLTWLEYTTIGAVVACQIGSVASGEIERIDAIISALDACRMRRFRKKAETDLEVNDERPKNIYTRVREKYSEAIACAEVAIDRGMTVQNFSEFYISDICKDMTRDECRAFVEILIFG